MGATRGLPDGDRNGYAGLETNLELVKAILILPGTVLVYVPSGRSGCCHRTPANRLKSESVETMVQPCSTAIAAC